MSRRRRRSDIRITGKNKRICIIAAIVFLVAVLAAVLVTLVSGYLTAAAAGERDAVIEPLERERARLRRELASLETDLTELLPNGSTITTLALELDSVLYDVVFPIYEGKAADQPEGTLKIVGTMCLSASELPGSDGNISVEQYYEMIASGWSSALRVSKNDTADLSTYYSAMSDTLGALGIPVPTVLYFESGAYSTALDAEILSLGVESVMHHREQGLAQIGADIDGALWRVGCISWNTGDTVSTFNRLVSSSGNLVITYAFSQVVKEDFFPPDIYGANYSFNRMLSMFRMYIAEGELEAASVTVGRDNCVNYNQVYDSMLTIMEARRAVLEEQIAQLDAQIFDIYSKHS